MQRDDFRNRVTREISARRFWRAKEILQGALATYGYEPHLFEQYGRLLLLMGDAVEAGKYLFLSGVRAPEYREAIALFVNRHARRNPAQLYYTFPAAARLGRLEDYPPVVTKELVGLGVPSNLKPSRRVLAPATPGPTPRTRLVTLGCALSMLVALVLMGLGVAFMVQAVLP
jgi:hypothetical protein